ncbi:MAG: ANTAR domain-containing response regulator [Anaerolineae bacterium]
MFYMHDSDPQARARKPENAQKTKVLIAEDSFLVREMTQGLVEDFGHVVIGTALNGRQAVNMTQSLRPDVVLMDIKMPELDGIEAAQEIFDTCPTPVVMLTAFESADLVQRATGIGIGAYLVKPPHAQELDRAISISIARFKDLMELRQLNQSLQQKNEELQEALSAVKTLTGLLPICASCKNIRDDEGYWQAVEVYIRKHTDVQFSHAVCPECAEKLYPEFYAKRKKEGRI